MPFKSIDEFEIISQVGVEFIPNPKYDPKEKEKKEKVIDVEKEMMTKAKLLAYQRDYYYLNRDKVLDYVSKYRFERKEQLYKQCLCECGRTYSFGNKFRHERSQIHKKWLGFNSWLPINIQ